MFLLLGRGRGGPYLYARLALLVAIVLATFAFHASGETLVIMRVARYALIALVLLGGRGLSRARGRRQRAGERPGGAGPPSSSQEAGGGGAGL